MSDEDENYGERSSDEEVEYEQTDVNPYPPTQPVHQNQVLELVHHNQKLKTTIRTTTANLQTVNRDVSSFYYQLRDSCRKLKKAYEQSQRVITQLKVDKYNLSRKLLEPKLKALSLDKSPEDQSRESENGDELFDDTVNSLQRQLQGREEQWRQCASTIKEEYESREYETKLEHLQELAERNSTIDTLKSQTTMLLQDAEKQKQVLSRTEESLKAAQLTSQDKELRILNLSKEIEAKEKFLWEKDDQVLSLRQDLEKSMATKKEKEISLEQIVRLYNELQDENNRFKELVRSHSEERDQIYAQYVCADESLRKKADEIIELKRKLSETESRDNVSVYMRQAEIYQSDFRIEREERQKLHHEYDKLRVECDRLKSHVGQYEIEMQRMKQELMRCHDMIRNRNGIPP